jgi:hypothetical protein
MIFGTPKIENFWRLKKIKTYKSERFVTSKSNISIDFLNLLKSGDFLEVLKNYKQFSEPKNEIFGGI